MPFHHPIQDFKASERFARLTLIRTERVGPITFHQLIGRYGTAEKALAAIPALAAQGGAKKKLVVPSRTSVQRELDACAKAGIAVIFHGTPDYPTRLAAVDDAPPVLFAKGHTHLLRKDCLGVVGTRNASAAGLTLIKKLLPQIGKADLVIASGLAKGIDAAAHAASLETGTIACMAGGVDIIYPRQNTALYQAVVDQGCAISEMPLGTQPQARHFPRRNRLISGLSLGVLVIEATLRSGSLITARMAGEQGREVLAVPGSPLDPRAEGTNSLLQDGATLVQKADDVLNALNPLRYRPISEPDHLPLFDRMAPSVEPGEAEIERIRTLLSPTPVAVDELISLSDLPPGIVQASLLALELAGSAERLPGGRVMLTLPE